MLKKNLLRIKQIVPKMNSNLTISNTDSNRIKNINYPNFITDYNPKERVKFIATNFEEKLKDLKKDPKKLMIVSDFDFTLTKKYHKDLNLFSSYCVLESSEMISEDFKRLNKELFGKYSSFENDISMDFETRDKLMQQWFKENLDLVLEENLSKEDFQSMILESERNFYYRYGILELFELIHTYHIPFFIISGGIFEIIEESLKIILPFYNELKQKNLIHIVANRFEYDSEGKVCGYKEPFVYTFNKGETLKHIFKEFNTGQENIIVMGDHLNDTDTIKHIDYENEIKIGFINYFEDSLTEQQHKMIEAYQLKYDVCLINDGNLTFVNNLIKKIMEGCKKHIHLEEGKIHVKDEKLQTENSKNKMI
jgi:HAD superfamily hydrolase (TIGR01544 family)